MVMKSVVPFVDRVSYHRTVFPPELKSESEYSSRNPPLLLGFSLARRCDTLNSVDMNDLADCEVFTLSSEAWDELQAILDRPATAKPEITALLTKPSVLDSN